MADDPNPVLAAARHSAHVTTSELNRELAITLQNIEALRQAAGDSPPPRRRVVDLTVIQGGKAT